MINKGRKEGRKGLQNHLPRFCSNFSPRSAHYSLFCLSCWPQHIHSFLKVIRAQSSSQPCWCLVSRAALRPLHDRRAHTGFDLSRLFDDFQKRKEKTFNPATLSSVRLVFKCPSSWLEAKVNTVFVIQMPILFSSLHQFSIAQIERNWLWNHHQHHPNGLYDWHSINILIEEIATPVRAPVLNTYLDFFGGFSSSESKKKKRLKSLHLP